MDEDLIFQSLEKSRLSDEVARQIAQAIRQGRYLKGQVLPSERELAARLNVSRPVLREALRILENQNLIEIQHGKGAFVKNHDTNILHVSVEVWLKDNYGLLRQFYEARLAIEPVCAALAAQRATDEEIAVLNAVMEREERLIGEQNVVSFIGADIDFHSMIATLSGNTFLFHMLDSLINPETDFRKIVLRLPQRLGDAHNGHVKVVRAIEQRDPEAARQAMVAALHQPLEAIENFLRNREGAND